MAYKINIRNQANTAWINLLEAQYGVVTDGSGYFTASSVEGVLSELFENKAGRVESASDPTATDDSYQLGTVWVNTTSDSAFICTDTTTSNAVWVSISSIEGVEDIVGAMFTGNTETNISTSYNDTAGTIELSVATATDSVLGVASFDSGDFVVSTGAVTLAPSAVTVTELAGNIDASAIGFNADQVDGTDVNDSGVSTADLWTASKIKTYVDSGISGLQWQESVIRMDLNEPPSAGNTTGDRYVVSMAPPAASGDWAGHDNDIAEYNGSGWDYTTVVEGMALWNENEDVQYVYNGTSWAKIGTTITHSNLLGLQGGNGSTELYHLTNAEHSAITGSKTANTVFAAPNGAGGVGGFRALVADDIPLLTSAKISDFDEAAQDAYGALVAAGTQTNITVTYNDATPSVDFSVSLATSGSVGVASFDSADFSVDGSGHVTLNESAIIDHGGLTGLGDDDHPQYVHNTVARTISAVHTFAPVASGAPFILGATAQGQLVTGLNADLLDGQHWTVAATASAPSSPSDGDIWIELTA